MSPFSQPYIVLFALTYFALAQLQLILVTGGALEDGAAVTVMLALLAMGALVFLNGIARALVRLRAGTFAATELAVVILGAAGLVLTAVWARLLIVRM